jgi:hypothetical protein
MERLALRDRWAGGRAGQSKHLNAIWPASLHGSVRMRRVDRHVELTLSGVEQFGCPKGLVSRVAERSTSLRASATAYAAGRLGRQTWRACANFEQPNSSMPSIEWSEATAAHYPDRVRALFFGDFLPGQQKKVTRPPGRNPGASSPAAPLPRQTQFTSDIQSAS